MTEATMKITHIQMDEILADEDFNCRGPITPHDVRDLVKSINEKGLIQPIVVIPLSDVRLMKNPDQKYLLIAGYRRFTAYMVLKLPAIPSIIRTDIGDEASCRIFNLSENLQRKELNIFQEAMALAKLEALGITEVEAGKRLGMARGWVQVRYMVLRPPELVQAEIAAGWLTQHQIRDCYSHLKKSGEEACFAVVRKFKDDRIKGRKGTRKKVKSKKMNPNTKQVRDKNAIFDVQAHIYEQFGGNTIVTRTLAWCAGEISNGEFHAALSEEARIHSKNYRLPE